jgi:hypothetical protein
MSNNFLRDGEKKSPHLRHSGLKLGQIIFSGFSAEKAALSLNPSQTSQITVDSFFNYLYHSSQLTFFDICLLAIVGS